MTRTIDAREAEALITRGGIDVVDVRDASEWATGHLPGARLVPLDQLRANPDAAQIGQRVLFVCGHGVRSRAAAELAEGRGHADVFSLDGGTAGWVAAGLPVVLPGGLPVVAPSSVAVSTSSVEPDASPSTDDVDSTPELGAIVGANVRSLRTKRDLTLDMLAGLSGVARQTLGQIELGHTVPSLGTIWKLAGAFDVPFSVLLARPVTRVTRVLRQASTKRILSADGRFSSRALFAPAPEGRVEFYELWLAGHGVDEAEAHAPGTRENLVVTAGRLVMKVGSERFELAKGDAIVFVADVPHAYVNPDSDECWMNLVMTYTG